MSSVSDITEFWEQDQNLFEVITKIQQYETWVESDSTVLDSMDDSILKVLGVVDANYLRISELRDTEELSSLIESMLVILGFMPAQRALYYLTSFQEYEAFFEALAGELNKAPPLKSYAKTLLARASVLQQRQLQKAVNSESNFQLLSQALERIFDKG